MEVKNEPVDPEYNEEGHPPDDGWYHVPIVKPEALETFEIPSAQNIASSTSLLNYSQKTLPISLNDIKKEVLGHQPIVVVRNLKKSMFHERNFVCSICMQLFTSFDSLTLHKNVDHNFMFSFNASNSIKDKQFDHCKKGLNAKFGLISSHCEKIYHCNDCGFKSVNRIVFKEHILKHSDGKLSKNKRWHTGETPFECDKCNYKSARKSQLTAHKLLHTGEKPFECNQCNYKSARKSDLKTHQKSHIAVKPFECDLCDYKAARKPYLKTHKLSHTGQKPFECNICDFKTARTSDLKTHKLLHTGEKPFECLQCDYKSVRKSDLKTHKLSHTGVKPFECNQCGYKSARKLHLKYHKLSHNG